MSNTRSHGWSPGKKARFGDLNSLSNLFLRPGMSDDGFLSISPSSPRFVELFNPDSWLNVFGSAMFLFFERQWSPVRCGNHFLLFKWRDENQLSHELMWVFLVMIRVIILPVSSSHYLDFWRIYDSMMQNCIVISKMEFMVRWASFCDHFSPMTKNNRFFLRFKWSFPLSKWHPLLGWCQKTDQSRINWDWKVW